MELELWNRLKKLAVHPVALPNPKESHLGSFGNKINAVRRLAHGKIGVRSTISNHLRVLAGRTK